MWYSAGPARYALAGAVLLVVGTVEPPDREPAIYLCAAGNGPWFSVVGGLHSVTSASTLGADVPVNVTARIHVH